jgi:hypothetical protein
MLACFLPTGASDERIAASSRGITHCNQVARLGRLAQRHTLHLDWYTLSTSRAFRALDGALRP